MITLRKLLKDIYDICKKLQLPPLAFLGIVCNPQILYKVVSVILRIYLNIVDGAKELIYFTMCERVRLAFFIFFWWLLVSKTLKGRS